MVRGNRMAAGRRPASLVLGAVVALALLAAGCSSGGETGSTSADELAESGNQLVDEAAPVRGGTMRIGITSETDGWNPAFAQWTDAGNLVGSSVYEPLFVYDTEVEPTPYLAATSEPNEDFTEWTITIRPDITFHDGTPVTADALVVSITKAATEGLASMAIGTLVDRLEAVDDLTFTVYLTAPWPTFRNNLTTQTGLAVAPAMNEAEDGMPDHPIGTGPYVFESWEPNVSFTVTANEAYWGGPCNLDDPGTETRALCDELQLPAGQPNGPFLDELEYRPLPDEDQRLAALRSGDVDVVFSSNSPQLDADAGYTVITDDRSEKTLVQLNTAEPPFDNVHARKALAYATRADDVIAIVSPENPPARDTSPFSGRWGLPPEETGYPEPDQEAARAEVAAYAQDTGEPTLSFTVKGEATPQDQATLQVLQQQWAEVGIETAIEPIEQVSLITTLVGGDFQAILIRNYAYPEPDSQYFFFSEASAQGPLFINFSQYTTPETETALNEGRQGTSFEARKESYDELVRLRNEAVTDIWLYNTPYTLIAEPDVRGLNPFRVLPWGNFLPKPWIGGLWLEPEADQASG